jgi:hypothetical protein
MRRNISPDPAPSLGNGNPDEAHIQRVDGDRHTKARGGNRKFLRVISFTGAADQES